MSEINSAFRITTRERTVVIVDNFYDDPDAVRRFALAQTFQVNPNDHKGVRTKNRYAYPEIKSQFEKHLGITIPDWDKHGYNGVFQICKGGEPLVYHSDFQRWAGVVYLTPNAPPQAGTTLVRSAITKGRTAEESARLTGKPASVCQYDMYIGKLLDPTAWETVDVLGNIYNRLVLWDGHLAHTPSCYFGDKKENGRLFQMFFFDGA